MINKFFFFISLFVIAGCINEPEVNDYPTETAKKVQRLSIEKPDQIVYGKDLWKGISDLSATVIMYKEKNGLLFNITVKDDTLIANSKNNKENDCIELYFDLRPERLKERKFYEKGVFQATIVPGFAKLNPNTIFYYPNWYNSEVPGMEVRTIQLLDTLYEMDIYIPFSGLEKVHYHPYGDFKFDIGINDVDSDQRETQMMWAGSENNWKDPSEFATILYEDYTTPSQPNVLFIFTDQQTLGAMSAYGNKYLQTPGMDAIASMGVRFTESYCTSPVCGPSRSSIITGRYPHETGVNYNGQTPLPEIENIGQILRKNGFRTIWAGKWHLPESYPHAINIDTIPGFELLNFKPAENMSGRGEYTDDALAASVINFLQTPQTSPFFLAVSFHNPHDICFFPRNKKEFETPLNPEHAPPLPDNFQINPNEPEFIKQCRNRDYYGNEIVFTQNFTNEDWRNYIYHYYKFTMMVDQYILDIVQTLEKSGLDKNTLIIFTSDHGDGVAAHKWAAKLSLYEESVKVPFIVSWFGKTPKNITNRKNLVSGIDITPTILDFVGIEPPVNSRGLSLKPIIEQHDSINWREFLVTELAPDPRAENMTGRMVRYKNYKYCIYSEGKSNEQLFNLSTDPGEKQNLINLASYQNVRKRCRIFLKNWIDDTNDTFIISN